MRLVEALKARAEKAVADEKAIYEKAIAEDREVTEDEQKEADKFAAVAEKALKDAEFHQAREAREARIAAIDTAPKKAAERDVNKNVQNVIATVPARMITSPDLSLQQKMGLFGWATAYGYKKRVNPLDVIETVGYKQLADQSREVAEHVAAETRGSVQKALTTLAGGGADNMIYTPLLNDFIPFLRAASSYMTGGPLEIEMPIGALDIAAAQTGTVAGYGAQDSDINYSDLATRKVHLSSKHLRVMSAVTNYSLEVSPLQVASLLGDDMLRAMVLALDSAGMRGSGTGNNPTGLLAFAPAGQTYVNAPVAPKLPTIQEVNTALQQMVNALASANVPVIKRRWIMSNRTWNFLRFYVNNVGAYAFPETREANPTFAGYPIIVSEVVPNNLGGTTDASEIYFADFGHLIMGITRSIRIDASQEASYVNASSVLVSSFSRDETVIRAQAAHDFNARYINGIALTTSVRWGAP